MRITAKAGAMMLFCLLAVSALLPVWAADAGSQKAIDTERSLLTVRVYKTGLFSAFAHDHAIRAPIQKGFFDEEKSTVELVVDARAFRVLDSAVSDNDQAEIQATMLGPTVLDREKFPALRLHATSVT